MTVKAKEGEGARTVGRVLKFLELVAERQKPIRLVDIASVLDMPASSAHVLAKQLVKYNYIQTDEDRRYAPSTGLVVLASKVMGGTALVVIARAFIEQLSEQTGESVYLGMKTDQGIVYVDAIEGTSGLVSRAPLGSLRSAHASSAGRVCLAYTLTPDELTQYLDTATLHAFTPKTPVDRVKLKQMIEGILRDGYSVNDQALTDKVCGVSSPIFDATAKLAGTITLSAPEARFEAKKDLFISSVVACAASISRACGSTDRSRK